MFFQNRPTSHRIAFIAAVLLIVALIWPTMAATTSITATKFADNNYSQSVESETFSLSQLQTLSSVYSNGSVYMQGPTFDANDPWGDDGQNMIEYFVHNGSQVSEITDEVGGMSDGDELKVQSSDGFSLYFGYDNVYAPNASQGDMIIAWWDSDYGFVPDYTYGIRLFFYTPPSSYGVDDSLNLTLRDMEASFDPWYRHNYTDSSGSWPSAKGLSAKYVQYLKIYPPHRHDFNTTGDTTGAAFRYQTGASPGVGDPNTVFTSAQYANIAEDDGTFQSDVTTTEDNYAAHRFNFSIDTSTTKDGPITDIEQLNITWNGRGWHNASSGQKNGIDLYIYNYTSGSYSSPIASTTNGSEVYLTGEKTSGIGNYISSTNNVTILVKQKYYHETGGSPPGKGFSHIETDYVKLVVTHHHHN